jgi:uncharacterized membrane protein
MAHYKERLTKDLDDWIEAGLIAKERRQAILDTVPDARRLDAGTALAWVGTILLGVAVIAFIAANWNEMPRLARFAIVLALFLGACAGAAWAQRQGRRLLSNALLTFASLAFAAAIGLTGQIFNIAGDPRAALYLAGGAAAALALAGGSTGAAMTSLILFALGDLQDLRWFGQRYFDMPAMVVAAPLGALLAMRWRSAPLAHVAALGAIYAFAWIAYRIEPAGGPAIFLSVWLALLGAGARLMRVRGHDFASVFYGWFVWGALAFYSVAGSFDSLPVIAHRVVWLAIAGGAIALGRYDRHALVTAAGVVSLIGAVTTILVDLGLDLMTAAVVFFLCALTALVVSFVLRRKAKA